MDKVIKLLEECTQLAIAIDRVNKELAKLKEVNNIIEAVLIL